MPTVLRFAGLWIIWSAWCNSCGWLLSAVHALNTPGYLAASSLLALFSIWWWKSSGAGQGTVHATSSGPASFRLRFHGLLSAAFVLIAALSLASGLLHTPWSYDAATYRLPRILYWWTNNSWYWIGTMDRRLDYSSCGFEWQMLPVILATRTDRLLFLLNWLPFLLMPGLVFTALRTMGVGRRSAKNWMWILPSGYCFAIQSSGVQNDGYSAGYTLAAVAFAGLACRKASMPCAMLSIMSAALLTGAKISTLPLLLPLAVCLWPALARVRFLQWKFAAMLLIALLASCAPLIVLSLKYSGDWTGDPRDKELYSTRSPVGATIANLIILGQDALQPPVFPGSQIVDDRMDAIINYNSPFWKWLKWSHKMFHGIGFGNMVYEGSCGMGIGVGMSLIFVVCGQFFIKKPAPAHYAQPRPLAWKIVPWCAWLAYAVFLAKIGAGDTPRYGAPYYPLLLGSILRLPRMEAFSRRGIVTAVSLLGMLSAIPIILLMPIRPLLPPGFISSMMSLGHPGASSNAITAGYEFWAGLTDDLAPIRNALPAGVSKFGFGAGWRDTSYGLWKPLGTRQWMELGLPLGSSAKPPSNIEYAVLTAEGIKERYHMDLQDWLRDEKGQIIFEMSRDKRLTSGQLVNLEKWYLVKIGSKNH